jgi:hypothetical protein
MEFLACYKGKAHTHTHKHCTTGDKLGRIFKKLVLAYFESAIPATT